MDKIDRVEIYKEIDLIQDCIKRMAQNSFVIKGWFIGLYIVVLGLLPEKINIKLLCIILVVGTILFWYLDAYFLQQEKKYRNIYKWVLEKREVNNKELQYHLNPNEFENKIENVSCIGRCMFSRTIFPFYLIPLILIIMIG